MKYKAIVIGVSSGGMNALTTILWKCRSKNEEGGGLKG